MIIAFDIDGVLADFTSNVRLIAKELWPGQNKIPDDYQGPYDWNYTDILNKEDWNQIWDQIKQTNGFWLREKEFTSNIASLRQFRKFFPVIPVYFITSRIPTGIPPTSAKFQTELWLLQRGLISVKEVDRVIAVSKAEEKLEIVKKLNIDYMIEDYGPTVENHNAAGCRTMLLNRPWNQEYNQPRVYSVDEFLNIVSKDILTSKEI